MTSVTIPSSTGPPHGGYPSAREQILNSESDCESIRSAKRCRSLPSTSDSCKKRRKQSTPIRIYNSEPESGEIEPTRRSYLETKSTEFPDNVEFRCHVCQLAFEVAEQLQNHITCEHQDMTFKKEPEDDLKTNTPPATYSEAPLCLSMHKPDVQFRDEAQNKEWMHQNVLGMAFSNVNPMFMAMSQYSSADNIQMKPIRIFNLDAYCGLCNKEFCNKYFLKTHKANKHGIYTDFTTTEQQLSTMANMQPFTSNVSMKLPNTVPSLDMSLKNETKPSANINPYSAVFPCTLGNKLPKQTLSVLPDSDLNDVQNRISASTSNGPSSSSDSDKVLPEDQVVEICASPSNTKTESTSAKNESDGTVMIYDSAKMSPTQSSREIDLSNRLRRIGVMNPKAFCEICNKEYCNKYFLRTHKMKRHGIYIADDKDQKADGMGNNVWLSAVQTSPLNLILTEQSPTNDRKTTSPNDISCDICGIKFQNASLAQLHNFTVHNKTTARESELSLDSSFGSSNSESNKKAQEICQIATLDKSVNSEAISEDLQKLQTMILQLNDLGGSRASTSCSSCNKEFENRFYLHAHMVTEHGMLLEDAADFEKNGESENINNNTLCDLCGKDFQNAEEMKNHILEAHSNISSAPDNNKEDYGNENVSADKISNKIFLSNSNLPERRLSVNITPTSSYCEICNKELCNKYFMKTHMQRMHGIEIENGSQIGGVVCDICNKELCSKYFLRVHKHNTHGIVEYGTSLLQPKKSEEQSSSQPRVTTPEPEPAIKPGDLADMSHRYFTHFTEVCPICSRRFRSTKWLKAHLINDHGQAGIDKWSDLEQQLQQSLGPTLKSTKSIKLERASPNLKAANGSQDVTPKTIGIQNVLSNLFGSDDTSSKTFQCSYCSFTSPWLPILFIHEKTHPINENIPLKCPVCPQSFLERELFQRHMYSHQPFLPLPPLFNGHGDTSKEQRSQENAEEENRAPIHIKDEETSEQNKVLLKETPKKSMPKISVAELPMEVSQSLQDVAEKSQLPATYALPQHGNGMTHDDSLQETPGYVMQAFLLEESASDRRVIPSVVFLPMLQKQPAPLTVTFTLTPA